LKAIHKPALAGLVLAVVGLGYFLFAYSRVETPPPIPQLLTAAQATTQYDELGHVAVLGTLYDDEGNPMPIIGPLNDDEGYPMPRPPSRTADDSRSFNGSDYRLERASCCPGE
jgi:hypothetical protein